jgi:hypothetical protein
MKVEPGAVAAIVLLRPRADIVGRYSFLQLVQDDI